MADKFGMMDEAYFKGKRELLDWVKDFLQIDVAKVEHMGKGAEYCQLVDALFPNSVKMKNVNFIAKTMPEYVKNWKLVQKAFQANCVDKLIPVQRLTQVRFQDNLEFLQWFHRYFHATYRGAPYDAISRRSKCKGGRRNSGGPPRPASSAPMRAASAAVHRPSRQLSRSSGSRSNMNRGGGNNAKVKELEERVNDLETTNETIRNELHDRQAQLNAKGEELNNIMVNAAEIEKERDFYYSMVLKIETICKKHTDEEQPTTGLSAKDGIVEILGVLHSSAEGDGADGEVAEGAEDKPMVA